MKSLTVTVCFPGGALFCKLTRELSSGDALLATLSCSTADHSAATQTHGVRVKEEPVYPAALHTEIQLLPQQAGMAAILATAVVNSESLLADKHNMSSQFLAFLWVCLHLWLGMVGCVFAYVRKSWHIVRNRFKLIVIFI